MNQVILGRIVPWIDFREGSLLAWHRLLSNSATGEASMAKRDNHYEAAFEAWLRWLRVPYVAVDEAHRTAAGGRSLKSLDFIVSPSVTPGNWLVDIKGRQFPTAGRQYWRNWSTTDELESLASWEELLGANS